MNLENIKKVEDLTIMSDTNKRLDQGWVLIGTYANNYDPQAYSGQTIFHYVVGLPESTEYIDVPQETNYDYPEYIEKS